MKEKIVLIDFANAVWRATTTFGFTESKHKECLDCDQFIFTHQSNTHCSLCGEGCPWDHINDKCPNDNPENLIVYNFFRNLRPLIEQFSPTRIFFCLEGHPKARHALSSEYKANRIIKTASKEETYHNVIKAQPIILEILESFPCSIIRAEDYECDDVIATLSENLKNEEIIIISNDSDYIQLLQKGFYSIKIFNPIKKEFMKAPEYHYVAWKSLNGDKSDNIKGLVGKEKAIKLVNDPILFQKFIDYEENRANFSINKQLIEFMNVPLDELQIFEYHSNFEKVKDRFKELNFESILKEGTWQKYENTFKNVY